MRLFYLVNYSTTE